MKQQEWIKTDKWDSQSTWQRQKLMTINAKNQEMIFIAGQGIEEVNEFTDLGDRREVV